MGKRVLVSVVVAAASLWLAASASAQSFGIGPRFSFVRGNLTTGTPSTRLVGGTMRVMTGPHTALEGALDYRAYYNDAGTERTRETPMQGSMLFFLVRSGLSPYVGGGIGLYTQTHETLGPAGLVTATTSERKVGWHLGAGAEIRLARHAAFFADYRFRFVHFGAPTSADQQPIQIPGSTLLPVLQNVKLSHEGSMWTSGVAFYF
jgi:opacity protein-like surface antigen